MLTIIEVQKEQSLSALRRTPQAQIAATKAFPKTAALIRKFTLQIKELKKKALKAYLLRKKKDALKPKHKAKTSSTTAKPVKHTGTTPKPIGVKKAHSAEIVISPVIMERLLDDAIKISDDDLAECCDFFESDSADKMVKGKKKVKKVLSPKALKHKKQMSAAMRIRENKPLRLKIKALLVTKKKLQDKAWALYVKKVAGKKKAKQGDKNAPVKKKLSPLDLKIRQAVAAKNKLVRELKKLKADKAHPAKIRAARQHVRDAAKPLEALKAERLKTKSK